MSAPSSPLSPTLLDRYPATKDLPAPTERPEFLDFVLKDGQRKAFRWDQLVWLDLLAGKVVLLNFASHAVQVDGTRLHLLYDQLLERRVRTVTHSDSASGEGFEVTSIDVRQKPTGERSWPVDSLKAHSRMVAAAEPSPAPSPTKSQ